MSVRLDNESELHDLEVPADIPSGQLGTLIAEALGWTQSSYGVETAPTGQVIAQDESLAAAGVWDGSVLVLHSDRNAFVGTDAPKEGPVLGFKPLGISLPGEKDQPRANSKTKPGSTWRQLDE